MRGWRAACSSTPLSDAWEPDAPEVAFRYLTRGPQNESLCYRWRNRVMERNAVSRSLGRKPTEENGTSYQFATHL